VTPCDEGAPDYGVGGVRAFHADTSRPGACTDGTRACHAGASCHSTISGYSCACPRGQSGGDFTCRTNRKAVFAELALDADPAPGTEDVGTPARRKVVVAAQGDATKDVTTALDFVGNILDFHG